MKTIWQVGRAALARALSVCVLRRSVLRASRNQWQAVGKVALAAGALLFVSLGVAQAQNANTALELRTSVNPSAFSHMVAFTAFVTRADQGNLSPVTGSVNFFDGTTLIGSGNLDTLGQTTFTIGTLSVGSHDINATYSGDSNFFPSSNSLTNGPQVVQKGNTAAELQSSANSSVFGSPVPVTFSAIITDLSGATPIAPGGTVTFLDGTATIGTANVVSSAGGPGTASLTITPGTTLALGPHNITANYAGDSNFNGTISGTFTLAVNRPSPPTITKAFGASSINLGQSTSLTFTIANPNNDLDLSNVSFTDNFPAGLIIANPSGLSGSCGGGAINADPGTPVVSIAGAVVGAGANCTFSVNVKANSAVSFTNTTGAVSSNESGPGNTATASITVTPTGTTPTTTTILFSPSNTIVVGQAVTITATVAPTGSGGTPTGQVTFAANGNVIDCSPVTLNNGVATCNVPQGQVVSVGDKTIQARYGGDSTFAPNTGSATLTVIQGAQSNVTISFTPSSTVVVGQAVTITARVTSVAPATGTPTGSVTFTANGGNLDGCSPVALNNGVAICNVPQGQIESVGTNTILASYSGDSTFGPNAGSATATINKANTTTTAPTSSANTSTVGQPVTLTTTVTVTAPGAQTSQAVLTGQTVAFLDGSTQLGTGMLDSSGHATFATSALALGSHSVTAKYGGDSHFNTSTSVPLTETVNGVATSTTVTTSSSPSTFGQSVTFTATVSGNGGPPGGTVTFTDSTTQLGTGTLSGGVATFTTATLAVGSHTIKASYGGDSTFAGSSNTVSQTVNQATTSTALTSSVNPSTFGQQVTFTAMVSAVALASGTPTGTVNFTVDGGAATAVALSNGVASFPISTLAGGSHTIKASYLGNTNFAASSNTVNQTVNKATTSTTLTSSVNPSGLGQQVTFTATVSGSGSMPTGTVTFTDATTNQTLGSGPVALSNGVATLGVSTLATGSHTITAAYNGDGNFGTSTSAALAQTVNRATSSTALTASPSSSTFGQTVTFTATVTGSGGPPTGTVTFTDSTTNQTLGSGPVTLSNGVATITTSTLGVGSHTIKANYGGDSNFGASSNTVSQTVNKATSSTTLTASPSSSTFGQVVTFTATVSSTGGTPSGTVTFADGTTQLGTGTLSNGVATFTTSTPLAVGSHTIKASYNGDTNFGISSGTVSETVNKAASSTAVTSSLPTSSFGQSVTFTATVSGGGGTPSGTVNFLDGATQIGSGTLSGGKATFTTSTLGAGSHTITANYGGDANFGTSSGTVTQKVNQTGTAMALKSSANPSAFGQSVTFTATITPASGSGTPTGTVSFSVDSGTPASASISGGLATFSIATLAIGSHTIAATYNGDSNLTGSNASLSQGVNVSTTTIALTSSPNPSLPNQAVTFTATISGAGGGTPTGMVTFNDGGTTLGTGNLAAGTATYTTSTLTLGSHSITASFNANTNFAGSTSAVLVQNVSKTNDSAKLHQLQTATTPIITQSWAQSVTGAMNDAVAVGFGGNPQSLTPAGTGFTYYFNDDAPAQPRSESNDESLRRYLGSPNNAAKRVDNGFRTLGFSDPTDPAAAPASTASAPAAAPARPHDWLAWFTVRGTETSRSTAGNDLKGEQIDGIAGLTWRVASDFVIGALGGYEHFDYSSQAFNGTLKAAAGPSALISAGNCRRISASTPAAPGRRSRPIA